MLQIDREWDEDEFARAVGISLRGDGTPVEEPYDDDEDEEINDEDDDEADNEGTAS